MRPDAPLSDSKIQRIISLLEKTDTAISEFAVKLGCRRRPVYEIIRKCSVRTSENRAQPVAVVFPLFVVLIILLSLSPDFAVGGDKLAHFGAYLLMALFGMSLTTSFRSAVRMLLAIVVIGAALEGVQAMIPTRSASGWDLVANWVGVSAGTFIWLGVVKTLRRWPVAVEN